MLLGLDLAGVTRPSSLDCLSVPALAAAAEEAGYFGNWALTVGATGLSGCRSFTLSQNWISRSGDRNSGDTYRRATVATYAELTRPGASSSKVGAKREPGPSGTTAT